MNIICDDYIRKFNKSKNKVMDYKFVNYEYNSNEDDAYDEEEEYEELKYYDSIYTAYTIDSTGEVIPVNSGSSGSGSTGTIVQVPQGDTEFQREGSKILINSICWKGYIETNGSSLNGAISTLHLILDTQANGALPSYTTIFENNSVNSFRSLSNSDRFIILKEYRIEANPVGINVASTSSISRLINIEGCIEDDIIIKYDNSATTGAISTIRSNNLFWVAIASNDDIQVLTMITRIRFRDS